MSRDGKEAVDIVADFEAQLKREGFLKNYMIVLTVLGPKELCFDLARTACPPVNDGRIVEG